MAHVRSNVLWSAFFLFAAGFCVTVSQKQNNSLLAQTSILSPERAMYSQLVAPASGSPLPSIPLPAQTSSALPDYAVRNLYVAPAVPEAGEEVSFHGKVTNVGQTRGSHRDFVQLQIDRDNNGTWDYTSNLDIVSGIPVGSSTNVQWGTTGIPPPIAWPRTVGTHAMKVCLHIPSSIDTDEYTSDANASNDCATLVFRTVPVATSSSSSSVSSRASSQASSAAAIPDFSLQDLRFYQDATGYATTVVVKNNGASTSKWAHVRLDIDGISGVMTYGIKPLATNATDTAVWSSSVLPPKNGWIGTEGYHTAIACIDNENGDPADSNAGNNCKQITFAMKAAQASSTSSASSFSTSRSSASTVSSSRSSVSSRQASVSSAAAGLPDHVVTAINVAPSGTVGRINAWGTVKNSGAGNSQNYSYAILEYRLRGVTTWTRIMQAYYIPALASNGEETALWTNFADRSGLPYAAGTYEFHVCADVWQSLQETNENNNCYPPMTVIIPGSGAASSAFYSAATDVDTPRSSSSSSRATSTSSAPRSSSSSSRSSTASTSSSTTNTQKANLTIVGFATSPTTITEGDVWGATGKVKNIGNVRSEEALVRLQFDDFNDGQNIFTSTVERVIPSLASNRQFSFSWSTRSPSDELTVNVLPGAHKASACVNDRRTAPESNYDDNCGWMYLLVDPRSSAASSASSVSPASSASSRSSVSSRSSTSSASSRSSTPPAASSASSAHAAAQALPDLWMTSFSMSGDQTVVYSFKNNGGTTIPVRGAVMRVSYTNKNSGNLSAWFTEYNETALNPGDSYDNTLRVVTSLPPETDLTKPLVAQLDPTNAMRESNERNNEWEAPLPVNDLQITGFSMTDARHITYSIKNNGITKIPARGVEMRVSYTNKYSGNLSPWFTEHNVSPLNAGSSYSMTANLATSLPSEADLTKPLVAQVDPANALPETNERNNGWETTIVQ